MSAGKVRITDAAGDLVAEFSARPAETSDRLVRFWHEWMREEPVTIERGRVTGPLPERWSSVPAAMEAWQALKRARDVGPAGARAVPRPGAGGRAVSQVAERPGRALGTAVAATRFAVVPAQTHLQAVRKARGWSQARALAELERVAAHRGVRLATSESLKVQLSRWENGHCTPDGFYTPLLCEVYAAEPYQLGIVSHDAEPDDPARLRAAARRPGWSRCNARSVL